MLGEESNADVIKAALTQTVGGEWRLTVTVVGCQCGRGPAPTWPQPPSRQAPPPPKVEAPPPPVPAPGA